jgi:hypothetical protein
MLKFLPFSILIFFLLSTNSCTSAKLGQTDEQWTLLLQKQRLNKQLDIYLNYYSETLEAFFERFNPDQLEFARLSFQKAYTAEDLQQKVSERLKKSLSDSDVEYILNFYEGKEEAAGRSLDSLWSLTLEDDPGSNQEIAQKAVSEGRRVYMDNHNKVKNRVFSKFRTPLISPVKTDEFYQLTSGFLSANNTSFVQGKFDNLPVADRRSYVQKTERDSRKLFESVPRGFFISAANDLIVQAPQFSTSMDQALDHIKALWEFYYSEANANFQEQLLEAVLLEIKSRNQILLEYFLEEAVR